MKQVSGCHACETCRKTGKACFFDDNFNTIAPAILEADTVVFTMPAYWYSILAQIKCVIDKLFSFCVDGKDIAGKACAPITCCEQNDMSVKDGGHIPIERSAAFLKWNMVGEVFITGVLNTDDIEKRVAASRPLLWLRKSEKMEAADKSKKIVILSGSSPAERTPPLWSERLPKVRRAQAIR